MLWRRNICLVPIIGVTPALCVAAATLLPSPQIRHMIYFGHEQWLKVYDVSAPSNPVYGQALALNILLPSDPGHRVRIRDSYLYVSAESMGPTPTVACGFDPWPIRPIRRHWDTGGVMSRGTCISGLDAPDLDADGDIDEVDFGNFQNCINGPNRPPNC